MGSSTINPHQEAQRRNLTPQIKEVTAVTTLADGETNVRAALPATSAADYIITLPPVGSSANQRFLIQAHGSGTGAITLADAGDGILSFPDILLDAAKDFVVIDNIGGLVWQVVSTNTGDNVLGMQIARIALAAVASAGGVFAWQNPEDVAILAQILTLDITTATSGASTIDVGLAANATTLGDTLIDGLSGAAAGIFDSRDSAGTNGEGTLKVDANGGTNDWITGSEASGAIAGIVGFAYILYHRISE